jgi:hypothetical protein
MGAEEELQALQKRVADLEKKIAKQDETNAQQNPIGQQLANIDRGIAELIRSSGVRKVVTKSGAEEYRITDTVPNMWAKIEAKIKIGLIGDIDDVGAFIKAHLKGKDGQDLSECVAKASQNLGKMQKKQK